MAIPSVVDLQLFDRNAPIVSISPLRAQLSSISPTTSRLAQNGTYLRIEIARVTICKRDRSKRFTRTVIYHFDRHSASRSASAIDQNDSQEQSYITSIDILRYDLQTRSIKTIHKNSHISLRSTFCVTICKRDRSKRFTRTVIYHFDRHSVSRSNSIFCSHALLVRLDDDHALIDVRASFSIDEIFV